MDGSRVRNAAVSGLIACGLLVGGVGGVGMAVATAAPGDDRGTDSKPRDRAERGERSQRSGDRATSRRTDRASRGPAGTRDSQKAGPGKSDRKSAIRQTGAQRERGDADRSASTSRPGARAGGDDETRSSARLERERRKLERRASTADGSVSDRVEKRLTKLARRHDPAARNPGVAKTDDAAEDGAVDGRAHRAGWHRQGWRSKHRDRWAIPGGSGHSHWDSDRDWDCGGSDPEEPTDPEIPEIVADGISGGDGSTQIPWGAGGTAATDEADDEADEEPTRTLDLEALAAAVAAENPAAPAAPAPVAAPPVAAPALAAPPVVVIPAPAAAPQPAVPPPPPPPPPPASSVSVEAAGGDQVVAAAPVLPASFRAGYPEYLRTAAMAEIVLVALSGAAGLALLTAAGGLLGYRQAKAGHAVRAAGTARFLQ